MGGIVDMFTGGGASDTADQYAEQAGALTNEQTALARLLRERYKTAFIPIENQLISDTNVPVKQMSGYLNSMGTINKNYRDTGANIGRTMGGRYQYGSGVETLNQASNQRNRVKALSDNYNNWDTNRYNRLFSLANMGRSNITGAQSGLNAATSGNINLANMYGQAAQAQGAATGQLFGNLGQIGMMYALGI